MLHEAVEEIEKAPEPASAIAQDPELVADFIVESREHIQAIEQNLLALEQDASSTEPLHALFRAFHTIKGIAGNSIFMDGDNYTIQNSTLDGRDPGNGNAIRGALAIGFGADERASGVPCQTERL